MANKPMIYEVEYEGEIYELEAPDGTSEADLLSAIQGYTPASTPSTQPAAGPEGVVAPTQDVETVAQMGADMWGAGKQAQPLSQEELSTYVGMTKDLSTPSSVIKDFVTQRGGVWNDTSEQELAAYRQAISEGREVSENVGYRELAPTLLGGFSPEYDEGVGDLGAALEEGMAYNPMGIASRFLQDVFDTEQGGVTKEMLQQQYPELDETQIEDLHDSLLGEMRRRELENATYQGDERGMGTFNPVRLAGNLVGGASPLDVVPLGRGVGFGARAAEAVGTNVAFDAALQAQDIAYGAQDEFNYEQAGMAGVAGAALQGAADVAIRGARAGANALRDNTPKPISERAELTDYLGKRDGGRYKGRAKELRGSEESAKSSVKAHVQEVMEGWSNAPEVTVINDPKDNFIGRYDGEGKFTINLGKVTKPEDITAATYHEALGHYGLEQKFREELVSNMWRLYDEGSDSFRREVDQWIEDNPDYYDPSAGDSVPLAVEEVLAMRSEGGKRDVKIADLLSNSVKQFSRDYLGMDWKLSNREINTILAMSHDAVVRGNPVSVTSNGTRYMFAGENAENADLSRLHRAKLWEGAGADVGPDGVTRKSTGWFKGPDGQWRFEINDSEAKPKTLGLGDVEDIEILDNPDGFGEYKDYGAWQASSGLDYLKSPNAPTPGLPVSKVLDHPKLFAAYPELDNITVSRRYIEENFPKQAKGNRGFYDPAKEVIYIASNESDENAISIILHELQHVIQDQEGFAAGGTAPRAIEAAPDDIILKGSRQFLKWVARKKPEGAGEEAAKQHVLKILKDLIESKDYNGLRRFMKMDHEYMQGARKEAYNHLFGEVEARDVQARQKLTDEQRLNTAPYTSEPNIDPESYIFDMDEGVSPPARYMRQSPSQRETEALRQGREIIENALTGYVPSARSWDEAKEMARASGLTRNQLKNLKGMGVIELDKRLYQYENAARSLDEQLAGLHAKMNDGTFTPADKAKYLENLALHQEVFARLFGDQAEIARALNAMKSLQYTKNKLGSLNELLVGMEAEGLAPFANEETFARFAKQVQGLMDEGNVQGARNTVRSVAKPYWWQYVLGFRHSMMLSGLGTHAKNAMDNGMMIVRELEESLLATPGYYVRKGLKAAGKDVEEGVSPAETVARMYGLVRAGLDAQTYKNTITAFKQGHGNREINSKVEMQDPKLPLGISKIQDALHSSDIFFRSFHMNANLYTLGVREAQKAGLTGKAAFEEGANLAHNPTEQMLKQARDMSDVTLLVDRPSYISQKLEGAKAIRPNMTPMEQFGAAVMNFMLPFFRVTDRLLFQQLRRSPLSFFDRVTREDFEAGGARRDIAIARTLYGTALIAYYWNIAGTDELEGKRPADYQKYQALEAGGYKENSVKEDGKYVDASALNLSLNPANFQNALASNVASIREAWERGEDVSKSLALAFLATGQVISSHSFAENLDTYMAPFRETGMKDATTTSANLVAGAASAFIPASVRQANQMMFDPIKRDTTGDKSFGDRFVGRMKSSIPGLSDNLPARRTVYGDTMDHGRTFWSIDNFQEIRDDPVSKELTAVEKAFPEKTVVTGVKPTFSMKGTPDQRNRFAIVKDEQVKLTAEGKQAMQERMGYYLREEMQTEISDPSWKQYSNEEKKEIIKDVLKSARKWAKEDMLEEFQLDLGDDE